MPTAIVFGGTGFVGRHLANRLVANGWRVIVPTRRWQNGRELLLLPTVEVIELPDRSLATLTRLLDGAELVVNLVGILHSRSGAPFGPDFAKAHVEWPKQLAAACRTAHVGHFIHISANGASPTAPSEYLRSKAAGEAAIRTTFEAAGGAQTTRWRILRPSVIFGPGDSFLNLFARLAALFPILPIGKAHAQLQPVYVGDVVTVLLTALATPASAGQTYSLGGPRVYTLKELVEYAARLSGHPRPVVALPDWLAFFQAWLMAFLPNPPLTPDNLRSLTVPNTVAGAPLPFGLTPTALEAIAPQYLAHDTYRGRYPQWRRRHTA